VEKKLCRFEHIDTSSVSYILIIIKHTIILIGWRLGWWRR